MAPKSLQRAHRLHNFRTSVQRGSQNHIHHPKVPFAGVLRLSLITRMISSTPSSQNKLANIFILADVTRHGGGLWWQIQSHEPRVFSHTVRSDSPDSDGDANRRSLSLAASSRPFSPVGSDSTRCRPTCVRNRRAVPLSLSIVGGGGSVGRLSSSAGTSEITNQS